MKWYYMLLKFLKDKYVESSLKKIHQNYTIVPLGTYCLPRCITTYAKIKPSKKEGEKSFPFDLAFYNNFEMILNLIETKFENFYTNLRYDSKQKLWINDSLNAIFNHDGTLSMEDFINRYNQRINNFFNYIAPPNSIHKFL